ncbi:G-box-binding factor-like [Hordeum vulgare subsp. vulgare]|uniref:G-box-binding factor-like n=1 Tax=Hordeum vulgare subsp. vulgare TaxID=112509 RepID=UPI001D1A5AE4|nr:G-box-binding factor-like [Hordeum vulgare subsp. vulgare]
MDMMGQEEAGRAQPPPEEAGEQQHDGDVPGLGAAFQETQPRCHLQLLRRRQQHFERHQVEHERHQLPAAARPEQGGGSGGEADDTHTRRATGEGRPAAAQQRHAAPPPPLGAAALHHLPAAQNNNGNSNTNIRSCSSGLPSAGAANGEVSDQNNNSNHGGGNNNNNMHLFEVLRWTSCRPNDPGELGVGGPCIWSHGVVSSLSLALSQQCPLINLCVGKKKESKKLQGTVQSVKMLRSASKGCAS